MQNFRYCPYCGAERTTTGEYCSSCGQRISSKLDVPKKKKSKLLIVLLMVIVICAVLTSIIIYGWPFRIEELSSIIPFSNNAKAIEAAEQSVVMLYCYDSVEMTDDHLIATGSGVIMYDDTTIVTNCHVIKGAVAVRVVTEQDLSYDVAGVLAYDTDKDIAVIRIGENSGLTPLLLGDSTEVMKGEAVVAVGSPLGIKNTVSTGVLSGRVYEDGIDVLQFTAPISSGSSGGALFDDKGKLIGITYASYIEGQNLNLAIPIEVVTNVYKGRFSELIALNDYMKTTRPDLYAIENAVEVKYTDLKYSDRRYNYDNKVIRTGLYIYDTTDEFSWGVEGKDSVIPGYNMSLHRITELLQYGGAEDYAIRLEKSSGFDESLPVLRHFVIVYGTFDAMNNVIYVDYYEYND